MALMSTLRGLFGRRDPLEDVPLNAASASEIMDPASGLPDQIFFACGALIGAAGGSLQAASRTMMARHTSPDRATEAFGLYALSGKATTYLGTMGIALFTLTSGSQRLGIAIPLIALFVLGMVFLKWVKPMGERS